MHNSRPIIRGILVITAVFAAAIALYLGIYAYHHATIVCKSLSKLEELINMDLTNIQIMDIYSQVSPSNEHTEIVICARAEDGYTENAFYVRTNRSDVYDPDFDEIPRFDIERLNRYSLGLDDVHKYGCCFGDIRNGMSEVEYQIRWYAISTDREANANLIISTEIPRRIYIDIPPSKE